MRDDAFAGRLFGQGRQGRQPCRAGRLCRGARGGCADHHRARRPHRCLRNERSPAAGKRHRPPAPVYRGRDGARRPAAVPDRREPLQGGGRSGRGQSGERARECAGGGRKSKALRTARQDAGGGRTGLHRRTGAGARRARRGRAKRRIAGNRADQPALFDDHRADRRPYRPLARHSRRAGQRQPGDAARGDPAHRSHVCRHPAIGGRHDAPAPVARQRRRDRRQHERPAEAGGRQRLRLARHRPVFRSDGERSDGNGERCARASPTLRAC